MLALLTWCVTLQLHGCQFHPKMGFAMKEQIWFLVSQPKQK